MTFTLTAFDRDTGDAIYDLDADGNPTWDFSPMSWERANALKREQEEKDRVARLSHAYDCTLVYEVEIHV